MVPVYISEAAPVHMRGSLTVSYNTLVVAGQFVATLVCGAFAEVDQGWRWMLGLAGVPAVVQFIGDTISITSLYHDDICLAGFIFMPESPRWLLSKSKDEESRKILKKIRPANYDIDSECHFNFGAY